MSCKGTKSIVLNIEANLKHCVFYGVDYIHSGISLISNYIKDREFLGMMKLLYIKLQ